MQRLTADLVLLTLCWTLPQLVPATDLSESTLNFLAIIMGDFNNLDQYQHGFVNHSFIQYRAAIVDIPVLQPAITMYGEWTADNKVLHMQIGVIIEEPRESIYINLFNFTDPSLYKPLEFNVSKLADVKLEDITGGNCTVAFKRLSKVVYVGYWSDCRHSVAGHHPSYCDTLTCDHSSIILPPTVKETFALDPYIFKRTGKRYKYTGIPDTYESICGKED